MKLPLRLLAAALLAAPAAHSQSSTRLRGEWLVALRDTPGNFALVDAATGNVRIATVDGSANVTWGAPIPTGLTAVTDACAGLPGTSGEILALTSASANRVILLDAATAAPFPRIISKLAGIGPSGVAPIGTSPNHELLIATRSNGLTPGGLHTHTDLSDSANFIATSDHATVFRRLQPLTAPGSTTTIALATADSGVNTRVELAARNAASHTSTFKATFTNTVEFATNIPSTDHPARQFNIGFRVGNNFAQLVEFSTPLSTASTLTSTPLTLPFAVSAVLAVPSGGVASPMKDGFIAIADDGTQAAHLRINATGTGVDLVATFPAEPGLFLNGIIPVSGTGIVKLSSTTPGGPSDSYHAYEYSGGTWNLADSGLLPALPAPGELLATLLFYNEDPIAFESARLLGVRHLAAWTRRNSALPVPADVIAETFPSAASGLTSLGNQPVLAPVGTGYVLTNQFEPGISIAAAGDLAGLMAPTLTVEPPSGTYDAPFQVVAEYDTNRFALLVRENGGKWTASPSIIPVAWSTTLELTLESTLDGSLGPILTRTYTLPAATLADDDSDNDGVPDYVELAKGLDPFTGSDFDNDGVSDLDELIQNTDPANPASNPVPNLTADVSPEGGVSLVATTTSASGVEPALLVDLTAFALDGSLVARAPMADLAAPLPDGGTRGATLTSNSAQPLDALLAVHSPIYFNLVGGARQGREIIAFFPATPPPPFIVPYTPVAGFSLSANADDWIVAAQTAATNRPPALARSIAGPADAAVAVLLEEIVHIALAGVRPLSDPPADLSSFTFLPGRTSDLSREFPTAADRALLTSAGFDFQAALALATTARANLVATANGIYQRHATQSEANPGIPLPIDALRTVLRGGDLPTGYTGAVTIANLDAARAAYHTARTNSTSAFRPITTWEIEVSPTPGTYTRTDDAQDVALLNADGTPFRLDRGLGLLPGTRFLVTGFTDTPPVGSLSSMEITTAVLVSRPIASDNDQDGNLLDDEWEKFFFGQTGQNPYAQPHSGSHTLLQYFLDGIDPRSGDFPTAAAVDLTPQLPVFAPAAGGAFTLDFLFPAAYQGAFTFVVERSTTLAPNTWEEVPEATIAPLGGDELRVTIPPTAAPPGTAFYRVGLALD